MFNPSPSPTSNATMISGEEHKGPAISWSAIIAGTFGSLALLLILLALGSGLGFASLSFGPHGPSSAKHFTYLAATWLIVVEWIASGLGGYLTGRLRTKWHGVHSHEVFFRDTAHGFLTWSVTTVACTLILFTLASSAVSGTHRLMQDHVRSSAQSAAPEFHGAGPEDYYLDSLFRTDTPQAQADTAEAQATPLFMKSLATGSMTDEDKLYISKLVASHTGLSLEEAENKVTTTYDTLQAATKKAEKAAASASIFTFLAMLIGAFIACVTAALGGQERDAPYPDHRI